MSEKVRISLNTEPTSLDPRLARDSDGMNILRMLFEGLTRVSSSGSIEGALAEEIHVSEEGLRYTFRLKPSVWSNGSAVTANDFVSSWKTILDPDFPTDIAYHLFVIKNAKAAKIRELSLDAVGVTALDDRTLVIDLERPTPYFLDLLAMPPFFPVSSEVAKANPKWALDANSFISNGPFSMKSWNHGSEIVLVKNERYFEKEIVSLKGVDLIIAPPDTALQMFEEGKIDWTGSPLGAMPIDAIQALRLENELSISPFLATYFLRVNTKDPVLSNLVLRRALASAIDRKGIVEHILQGGQKEALRLVPPEMGLSKEGYFREGSDWEIPFLEKPIVLSYYNNERNASIAQAIQKQWKEKLQIPIQIEAVEPKVYFQRVSKGEFQLATGSWTADFNDPVNFLEVFKYKDNGTNNTGWEDPRYIDLLNRSQLCRDVEERKQLLEEAEKVLMDQMPLIPIYHFALNYLKKSGLEGVYLSPLGQLDLRWAHLELEHPSLQTR